MSDPVVAARARARRALAALLIFIVAVVAVAGFIAWRGSGDTAPTAEAPAASASDSEATAGTAAPPLGDDGLDDPSEAESAPGATEWVEVNGLSLPVVPGVGPASLSEGRATGFAQCGTGAALAAVHLFVRSLPEAGPEVFEATIAEQFTGESRDALAEAVADGYTELLAEGGGQIGPHQAGPAAVRIDYATDTSATIRLLLEPTGEAAGAGRVQLIITTAWIEGDWRLVAPAGGSWESALSGYSGTGEGFTYLADLEACDGD